MGTDTFDAIPTTDYPQRRSSGVHTRPKIQDYLQYLGSNQEESNSNADLNQIKYGSKSIAEAIHKKKQYLFVAKKMVNDQLRSLEDPISSKWLQQQLETSSDSRASLTAKNGLLHSHLQAANNEITVLRGQLKRKEQSFTLILQRQQDARLRALAIRRIRKIIQTLFFLWRDVRSSRVRYFQN